MLPPVVTVAIPAYNHEASIGECLDSVLSQEEVDVQVVVLDDNSVDGTWKVLSAITDPRVRVVRNTQRLGLIGNHNACIAAAETDLLMILHADDVLLPGGLSRLCRAAEDPGTVLAFAPRRLETDNRDYAKWLTDLQREIRPLPERLGGMDLLRLMLRQRKLDNAIGEPSCVLVRTAAARAVGGFNPEMYLLMDLDMWIRIAAVGDVGYAPQPVGVRRHHAGAASATYTKVLEMQFERLALLCFCATKFPAASREQVQILRLFARHSAAALRRSSTSGRELRISCRRIGRYVGLLALSVLSRRHRRSEPGTDLMYF